MKTLTAPRRATFNFEFEGNAMTAIKENLNYFLLLVSIFGNKKQKRCAHTILNIESVRIKRIEF